MGSPSMEEEKDTSQATQTDQMNRLSSQSSENDENLNEHSDTDTGSQYNSSRRGSLPNGLVEHIRHIHPNVLCGKILRFIGDEHYSKACGQHLRYMGDEMCYSYLLRNRFNSTHENNSPIQNSRSLPDLSTLTPRHHP